MPGFIGFGTSQSDLGYVPAIQGAEEVDSLVDADFRMVLRKLSKRDVTTKLKVGVSFAPPYFFLFLLENDTVFLREEEEISNFTLVDLLEWQYRLYPG